MKKCFLLCTDSEPSNFYGLTITVKSLEKTNPNTPIVIFHNNLSEEQLLILKSHKLIEVRNIIDNRMNRPDLGFGCFYRFYFSILDDFDKVLYLDNDVVVLDSLDDFFEKKGFLLSVGRKRNISDDFRYFEQVQKHEKIDNYIWGFNTGVMCFDINLWRNTKVIEKVTQLIDKYGLSSFKNPVNCLMYLMAREKGEFTSLSCHYNFTVNNRCESLRENDLGILSPVVVGESVKILHWNGNVKPWHKNQYKSFEKSILQKMRSEGFEYDYIFEKYYSCFQQFITSG
jgi:lipopolysaccharide biosynthesis glycosyltransferase